MSQIEAAAETAREALTDAITEFELALEADKADVRRGLGRALLAILSLEEHLRSRPPPPP